MGEINFASFLGKLVRVEDNVGNRFTGILKDVSTQKIFVELHNGKIVNHLKRNIKNIVNA